jgi:hypothetical protein
MCKFDIYILFYFQGSDPSLSLATMVNYPSNKDNEKIIVQEELMTIFPSIVLNTFMFC